MWQLHAPPGCGKTHLLLRMVRSVRSGCTCFGMKALSQGFRKIDMVWGGSPWIALSLLGCRYLVQGERPGRL